MVYGAANRLAVRTVSQGELNHTERLRTWHPSEQYRMLHIRHDGQEAQRYRNFDTTNLASAATLELAQGRQGIVRTL